MNLLRRSLPWSGVLLGVGATLLAACGDDGGTDPQASATGTTGDPTGADETAADETATSGEASVTFWQDVAPIFYERCVTCHRDGGIGPFPMTNYEEASPWSAAILASMEARTMPPWLLTGDGSCGEFRHSRWVPDEQLATVAQWVADGTPEGEPRDDLEVPELPGLDNPTEFSTPMFEPEIQGGELAEFDEYRCFLVDPGLTEDRYLTAYDVVPGNEALVHHVLVMPVDPNLMVSGSQTNAEVMAALDDESPDRDGWPCFGEAGDGVETEGIPVAWAPGQGVVDYPEGTGLTVGAGHQLVIQVHYNLADPATHGQSDQTTVQLRLEESVERSGVLLLPDPFLDSLFGGSPIEVPPGQESWEYTWELSVADLLEGTPLTQIDLYGVFPHMHEYGQAMRLEIGSGDDMACAADVPNWDFAWQLQYFYEEPITLTTDDVLRVTCDFDTTTATEPVLPGWGTNNEMCLMGMYLVP